MNNINTDGLPPEMQQRIAEIIDKAKANASPQPQPQQPVRMPSLMDHMIALRQENAQLQQMVQEQALQMLEEHLKYL